MRSPLLGPDGLVARFWRPALIVIVALIALIGTVRSTVAGVFRNPAPAIALKFDGGDAMAKANLATSLAVTEQPAANAARIEQLSREALASEPLSVVAMRNLAVAADLKRDPKQARALLDAAERLSRRDQLTQLMLIEAFSAAGDVPGTLRHYDIAMRATRQTRQILIPNLVKAADDPALVEPIAALVARRAPQWWADFMLVLIDTGQLDTATKIATRVLDPRVPNERQFLARLIGRNADAKRYDLAWAGYVRAAPGAARADAPVLRRDFLPAHPLPPFDWQLSDDPAMSAQPVAGEGNGGRLELTASDGRAGEVARQMIRLPAGTYQVAARFGNVPAAMTVRPRVTLTCAKPQDSQLAEIRPDRGGAGPIEAAARFSVPVGCEWVWLGVTLADSGRTDALPWVEAIRVERAR